MANQYDANTTAVQAHLSFLQGNIARMANNSSSAKAWCITVVSAMLAFSAEKQSSEFILVAIFPTILFCFLDVYYLALERSFRSAYTTFVGKLHRGALGIEDLFKIAPEGEMCEHVCKSFQSC